MFLTLTAHKVPLIITYTNEQNAVYTNNAQYKKASKEIYIT